MNGILRHVRSEILFAALAFIGVLLLLSAIFGRLFPGPIGIGDDYAFFLPDLLSNYYFAKANGPWFAPWFTPAFCGGQPAFGDPQSMYYSVPQLLAAFFDPVDSLFWTLQTFAALGFLGTYLFLKDSMKTSNTAAITGAILFSLNGFFSHRMLIGHLTFHGIMLVPVLAWAATSSYSRAKLGSPKSWGGVLFGALIAAYWVYSGMAVILLPAMLSLLALFCLYGLRGNPLGAALAQFAASVVVGLALSASKVVASLAYIHNFPRDGYALGGLANPLEALQFALAAVFLGPEHISSISAEQLSTSRQEYEFSVTPFAAILLGCGAVLWLVRWLARGKKLPDFRLWALALMLLGLVAVPILMNTAFGPLWESTLKSLPIIKSSRNMLRWFVTYIPLACVAAALCVDSISSKPIFRLGLLLATVLSCGFIHFQSDLRFYASAPYDPRPVQLAFKAGREHETVPPITQIAVFVDRTGKVVTPLHRNDLLANGGSSLLCYNPIFGRDLETFPIGQLHPGSVLDEKDGYLNLKNPACYIYPEENFCKPGSHFTVSQRADAKAFSEYRPFEFKMPPLQHLANLLSLIMFFGTAILISWIFVKYFKTWRTDAAP